MCHRGKPSWRGVGHRDHARCQPLPPSCEAGSVLLQALRPAPWHRAATSLPLRQTVTADLVPRYDTGPTRNRSRVRIRGAWRGVVQSVSTTLVHMPSEREDIRQCVQQQFVRNFHRVLLQGSTKLARWSRGMILASGARGPGFNSRTSPRILPCGATSLVASRQTVSAGRTGPIGGGR